jgi:hypothetical protein
MTKDQLGKEYLKAQQAKGTAGKDFLHAKQVKKKTAQKGVWILVVFGIVFVFILIKIANSNSMAVFSGLPSSDVAYSMAKVYIRPTVRSTSVSFHDDSYKFAKKSDSVYVIKSSYTAHDSNGESTTTNFTISLRYMGGSGSKEESWKLLELNQD